MKQTIFNVVVGLHLVFLTVQVRMIESNLLETMETLGALIAFLSTVFGGQ